MKRKLNSISQKQVTVYAKENKNTGSSKGKSGGGGSSGGGGGGCGGGCGGGSSTGDLSFMNVDWSKSTFDFTRPYNGCN